MATKVCVYGTLAGPDGENSGFIEQSFGFRFETSELSDVAATRVCAIVPQPETVLSGGTPDPQPLPSPNPIQRFVRAAIALDADLVSEAALTISISVYRSGSLIGGTGAYGWLAAGGGTPAFTAFESQLLPAIPANTLFAANSIGSGIFVLPGDVLVATLVTTSGDVAWPGGLFTLSLI